MTLGAVICSIVVATVFLRIVHQRRPLAERLVDTLYRAAAVTYAVAQAADSALCRYRSARQEMRESHVPMYAEVR
jgi:hypothetical protein